MEDSYRIVQESQGSKCHHEAVEVMLMLPATTQDVGEQLVGQLSAEKAHNCRMFCRLAPVSGTLFSKDCLCEEKGMKAIATS